MKFRITIPSSTRALNWQLDQQIVDREPPDYDAPWFGRRYFATFYSTLVGAIKKLSQ
jgi:hypothetical protein